MRARYKTIESLRNTPMIKVYNDKNTEHEKIGFGNARSLIGRVLELKDTNRTTMGMYTEANDEYWVYPDAIEEMLGGV